MGMSVSWTSFSTKASTPSRRLKMKAGKGPDLDIRLNDRIREPSGFWGGRGRVVRRIVLGWAIHRLLWIGS